MTKVVNNLICRQGDVAFKRFEGKLPDKKVKNGLLKIGESMNHGHYIVGEGEVLEAESGTKVLVVQGDCSLKHAKVDTLAWTEEHDTIIFSVSQQKLIRARGVQVIKEVPFEIKVGDSFELVEQIEYDPYEETIRKVRD